MNWDTAPNNAEPFTATIVCEQIAMERNPKVGEVRPVSPEARAIEQSKDWDFAKADHAPAEELNLIIWKSVMGWDSPMPKTPHGYIPASAKQQKDDDDD